MQPDNVTCLSSPKSFHEAILVTLAKHDPFRAAHVAALTSQAGIRRARKRVYLSALYIGTDPVSAEVVAALRAALEEKPEL